MKYQNAILGCLIWGLLQSLPAFAVLVPQPIGMYVEEVDGLSIEDDLLVDSAALLAHERRVQEVLELQSRLGAYDQSLGQKWIDLAHDAVKLKQPESAARLFQQGLHNLRLNAGLTTDKQVIALSEWIAVLKRLGDTESLGEQLQYRYRITGFGAGDWSEESLGYALEHFDNELSRFATSDWLANENKVVRFERHLDDVIERSCEGESASAAWCGPLVKRRLQLLYLIAFAVEPFVEDRQTRNSLPPKFWEIAHFMTSNWWRSSEMPISQACACWKKPLPLRRIRLIWSWH